MSKYYVGNVAEGKFSVPANYAARSKGYRRLELIDHYSARQHSANLDHHHARSAVVGYG